MCLFFGVANRHFVLSHDDMNAGEWKTIEGQRIQAVLGAVGALPAASLVFGDDPAKLAPGAPLFAMAIMLVIGAYMHWLYTDGIYHMTSVQLVLPEEHMAGAEAWEADAIRVGYRFQAFVFAYAIVSLGCSLAGLAGVYSTLRAPISINAGFLTVALVSLVMAGELIWSRVVSNRLLMRRRDTARHHVTE